MDGEAGADKAARTAQAALDRQVLDRCAALTEAEIRTLAVADRSEQWSSMPSQRARK